MKKILFVLLTTFVGFSSCNKTDFCPVDTAVAPASEVAELERYLNENGIVATKDSRGFFYIMEKEGSGKNPNTCSTVSVAYKGRLTNGFEFDSSVGSTFGIGNLIRGWKQAIPLLKPGGSMKLYIPPSLAYGALGSGSKIPPNSYLIFDIELIAIR